MAGHRMSAKKVIVLSSMFVLAFGMSTRPAFAAENIFQQIQQGITTRFQRIYLQLIPGNKPGKMVLQQMGAATQNVKSFSSRTDVSVKLMGEGSELGTASVTATGPTVVTDLWNPKTYQQEAAITGSLSYAGATMDLAANTKLVDGVSYLQLRQLPELGGIRTDSLLNTWVRFEQATAAASLDQEALEKTQTAFYNMLNASEVSDANVEQKDGNDVYVFTAKLSKPAVAEYITAVRTAQGQAAELSEAQEALENVGDITVTFWVDKRTFYPRHVELPLQITVEPKDLEQMGQTKLPTQLAPSDLQNVDVKITTDMTQHNESFTITAPENAENSQVFITRILSLIMPGLPSMNLPSVPAGYRPPTVGTTELPAMTPEQKRAIEQYEKMMGTTLPMPINY